jgi:hypothetical protein
MCLPLNVTSESRDTVAEIEVFGAELPGPLEVAC